MSVAIVGAGVAGTLLALRLAEAAGGAVSVDLFTGTHPNDASGASGGLVRGYEPDPGAAALAAASVAELRSDRRMRDWSGYTEIGSLVVTPVGEPPVDAALAAVHERLPGSLRVGEPGPPLRGVPEGAVAVVERHAGFISPARLRATVLAELPGLGVTVHTRHVTAVTGDEVRCGADGFDGYRAVVVAAGAWTRDLVGGDLTTRQIQYGLYPVRVDGLPSFVDETSGLYGRPHDDGRMLFGLSSDRWGLAPAQITPDDELSARVTECVATRLGITTAPDRVVASFDCYTEPAGLRLRRAGDVLTFTGGSGGAAKSVVAASRAAARDLAPVLEGAR